jgi:hypothetical protein
VSPEISLATIPPGLRAELLKREPYKPRIFGLEGAEETGLLLRVKDPAPFRNPDLPIAVKLVAYQSAEETWLVAVVLRVEQLPPGTLIAAAYLNPHQSTDYELLRRLSKQLLFPIIFLEEHVRESIDVRLSWSSIQREEVLRIIEGLDKSLAGRQLSIGFDPAYEAALAEFQNHYSLKDLFD